MRKSSLCILIIGTLIVFAHGVCVAEGAPPDGMMIELLQGSSVNGITDATPEFGWIVHSSSKNDMQSAYRILVSSNLEMLGNNRGDVWDSGKTGSNSSINVPYQGNALSPSQTYFWKVKTWTQKRDASSWSRPQKFVTAKTLGAYSTPGYSVVKWDVAPSECIKKADGHYFVDFGRAAAGTVRLSLTSPSDGHVVTLHLGEKTSTATSVDPKPGGTIRYAEIRLPIDQGTHTYLVKIPAFKHKRRTLKMPEDVGEVMPFRYCELTGVPGPFDQRSIQQVAVHYPFDDRASEFSSSDETLNKVWELCRYSIKATSYCGLYIDGDRERFPREADSYINQISHYCVDREYTLGRRTHEFMMTHTSQWTEWMLHSVIMAWTDYLYTGNRDSLEAFYDDLKHKTLTALARQDGLISTKTGLVDDQLRKAVHYYKGEHVKGKQFRDIVDWPSGERDGYRFGAINTVVNAFHYRALVLMASIARELGKDSDAKEFAARAALVKKSFNSKLIDPKTGLYLDGEGVAHSSLHANMFPLALGLVPSESTKVVTQFIRSRGMACSVYGAQYLLESLYAAGEDEYALELMTSKATRSWYNMLRVGSTITLEAWDLRFKKNMDWNHAWGAAPANIIPRYVLGVRPLEPGFSKVLIQPQPGALKHASGTIPTIRGPITVSYKNDPAHPFELSISIPVNMTARVGLPQSNDESSVVIVDGEEVNAQHQGKHLFVDGIGSGAHVLTCK